MPSTQTVQIHVGMIVLVYVVCFGAFNFVNVPFWDDWVLLQYGVDGLWELFKQTGRREHYLIIAPLVALGQPMVWAVLSFLCWGAVALIAYFFLQMVGWARGNAFWAALLTAAMPLNQSRFALAMTSYSVCAALFALGLLLLATAVREDRVGPRIWAALLLTLSFSTNSFLTMSWLAPATVFLVLLQDDENKRFWPAAQGTFRYLELFILPIAYWISKILFQPVYGLYADYNSFRVGPLEGLFNSVLSLIAQIPNRSSLEVIFTDQGFLFEALIASLIVVVGVIATIGALGADVSTQKGKWVGNWLLVCGLVAAAVLALFPYAVVGIRPGFYALWETRHQTTLAIIAGVLVFALMRAALPARAVPAACLIVLTGCIAMDVSASRQLLADVYESNAIINSPAIAKIEDGTLVGVFERDRSYRMFQRHFQFYDLSSMLNAHSPEKTLVALSNYEVIDPLTQAYVLPGSTAFSDAVVARCLSTVGLPQYGFGDVVATGAFTEVTMQPRSPPPGLVAGLASAFGLLFDRQATIDRAVADLDVTTETREVNAQNCGHPGSN